ncbi:hypothetical protein N7470_007305 [Penicillium chermesinum]|nr:hypothetical protein N7470_007305 [Penicillium chermesinum]
METNPERPRTRARKACLACNARRVSTPEEDWLHGGAARSISAVPTSQECSRERRTLEGTNHAQYIPSARHTPTDDSIHRTVFLGESSPLTCVVDEGQRSPDKGYARNMQQGRLRYSISERSGPAEWSNDQHRKLLQDRLVRESALVFPSPAVCDTFLQAYFDWFHPCFPVLDRRRVEHDYKEKQISPLLLQAMLFIGVSICSDSALQKTGFSDRYRAKGVFYQRAKEIYDVGWETETIVKLQSLFLLSFWRGGPTEERDVRFWLGAAIGLAQKKGMHVMSKLSFLGAQDLKIWKRIWWALYGLPSRIRDEDCEVADLTMTDLEEDGEHDPSEVFRRPPPAHVAYVIGMAQLARLLREVVSTQYLPGGESPDSASRSMLHQRLVGWEANLPPEMQYPTSAEREVMFLVGMLHITYNYLYSLLYRSIFLKPLGETMSAEGNIALEAATRSTRILEDMLSENLVQHGPLHVITHTFSALCIHTIHFGRAAGTARKLAEHRAKLCLLGLKELQKSWDLENWVLDLFFRSLDDRTARDLRLADTTPSSALPRQPPNTPDVLGSSDVDRANTSAGPLPATESEPFHGEAYPSALPVDDGSVNMDWYELFNVEGDDLLGLPNTLTNPDYVNPRNLEFLYRFL